MLFLNFLILIAAAATSISDGSQEAAAESTKIDRITALRQIWRAIASSYTLNAYSRLSWPDRIKGFDEGIEELPESAAKDEIAARVSKYYKPMFEGDDSVKYFVWSAQKSYTCREPYTASGFHQDVGFTIRSRHNCIVATRACEAIDGPGNSEDCQAFGCNAGLPFIATAARKYGYPYSDCKKG